VIEPAELYEALRRHGLTFFTGVPDSLLKDFCAYVNDHVPPDDHVITANEGAAVALATGYHLATGRAGVVYLQNSGLGNAVNPLLSLADPAVYAIPMLVVIGWRGEPGINDEPQHVTQGRITEEMLRVMNLPYEVLDADTADSVAMIGRVAAELRANPRPWALLVRKGAFATYRSRSAEALTGGLERRAAIEAAVDALPTDAVVVSTTGFTSRELFAVREERGTAHALDFLTVGSMGHASQIALGMAARLPERTVVCLDGDGAMLMHMGALAVIGARGPANLRHVVINNGAHDSVGGQPTVARSIDLPAVARACGYRATARATTAEGMADAMREHLGFPGPTFLEVVVRSDPTTHAGRPTTTPRDNKVDLMRQLGDA
jgi:phosphonopyruvate decarboxylase